ncbi:unnamed protein product [Amoebophrya sp. A120]|nr:unnamed protein product [Amoebophrya sp. A120]|eukprot:GSA120T00021291001.1
MNDGEAEQQIKQMVNFILNEAKETAAQITDKANEDFNVEKLKLVQAMKEKTRTEMADQKKKVMQKAAIARSTAINKARIKKIEARQNCMELLSGEVAAKLKDASRSEAKYKQILIDLIVQGCLKLMEEEVTVKVRAADVSIARGVLDSASQAFAKTIAKATNVRASLKLTLDSTNLPATCLGGVVLSCQEGTISVDNTLDTRLKLCLDNDKPELRKMLFPKK